MAKKSTSAAPVAEMDVAGIPAAAPAPAKKKTPAKSGEDSTAAPTKARRVTVWASTGLMGRSFKTLGCAAKQDLRYKSSIIARTVAEIGDTGNRRAGLITRESRG